MDSYRGNVNRILELIKSYFLRVILACDKVKRINAAFKERVQELRDLRKCPGRHQSLHDYRVFSSLF